MSLAAKYNHYGELLVHFGNHPESGNAYARPPRSRKLPSVTCANALTRQSDRIQAAQTRGGLYRPSVSPICCLSSQVDQNWRWHKREDSGKCLNRILLVMATGTGKTYTAFQIIWRLWKVGRKKRILFLADRNVLVDQTMVNDFRAAFSI